jgi:hypothetical protein
VRPRSRTGRASGRCGSGKGQTRREPAVDQEPDGEGDARTTSAVNSCDQRQRRGQPADCAYVPLLAQSHYSAPQPQTAPRALLSLSCLPSRACARVRGLFWVFRVRTYVFLGVRTRVHVRVRARMRCACVCGYMLGVASGTGVCTRVDSCCVGYCDVWCSACLASCPSYAANGRIYVIAGGPSRLPIAFVSEFGPPATARYVGIALRWCPNVRAARRAPLLDVPY